MKRSETLKVLKELNTPRKLTRLICMTLQETLKAVNSRTSEDFLVTTDLTQDPFQLLYSTKQSK